MQRATWPGATYPSLANPYPWLDIACVSLANKVKDHSEFLGLQIQNPSRCDMGGRPFHGLVDRMRPQ